jgi:uroporphyrinogen decarboxylase
VENISHRQRLERCLSGVKPDRVPVAIWRHFPVDDQASDTLAAVTLAFQRTFDFDLVKIMPSSSYCIKDWGAEDEWHGSAEGTRSYTKRVINDPEDWRKLSALDPHKGYLGEHLRCVNSICKALKEHTPALLTIFNPLSQAKNLVGPENLIVHLRSYPDAVHQGLKVITETTLRFLEAALETSISGIFYAVQHAQHEILNREEYKIFGRSYDLEILQVSRKLWLNMLHLHGREIMFDLFCDYPVQTINWHDQETSPTLATALTKFHGSVCGGIDREGSLVLGTPEIVKEEAVRAIDQTGGKRLILGTGCVVPITAPYGNILALRNSVLER